MLAGVFPSIPYPPPKDGYWLPVTSTINWCEEDYYATIYTAEIVNSLTNILFLILAGRGFFNCLHNGHDTIFAVTCVGYLMVGLGSLFFHASLKYPMQLVDELSMIYTTGLMVFATFSYSKSRQYAIVLGLWLIGLMTFVTLYYHYLQDPVFHQIVYALLTTSVVLRSIYVMETNLRPSLRRRKDNEKASLSTSEQQEQERRDQRDLKILGTMWRLITVGLSTFLGGFVIWKLDNVFCSTARRWRAEIGLPWGVLLEGHGWWHLMTGLGAYYYIAWGIWLRHCLNGRQDEYEMQWPSITASIPFVIRRKHPTSNTKVVTRNGAASYYTHNGSIKMDKKDL